ncbi:MAG: hypothetical protein H6935_01645 [Thiobacillus sp.]|nr:hypothetical protein [Thiobacillus sp.]
MTAVDLNTDLLGRYFKEPPEPEPLSGEASEWMRNPQGNLSTIRPKRVESPACPGGLNNQAQHPVKVLRWEAITNN